MNALIHSSDLLESTWRRFKVGKTASASYFFSPILQCKHFFWGVYMEGVFKPDNNFIMMISSTSLTKEKLTELIFYSWTHCSLTTYCLFNELPFPAKLSLVCILTSFYPYKYGLNSKEAQNPQHQIAMHKHQALTLYITTMISQQGMYFFFHGAF